MMETPSKLNFRSFMRHKSSLLIFFLCLWVPSCIFGPNGRLGQGDNKRTYSLHLPKGYRQNPDKAYPLLLLFHGNPSRGWQMARYTGMNKTADEKGFIVAYPDATHKRWAYQDEKEVQKEVDYVQHLLKELQGKYRIDSKRIFSVGMSGGGIFTFNLADKMPEQWAGIAVVSGNMPVYLIDRKDKKPLPFLYIHGTEDFLYRGRDTLVSAPASLEYWQQRNKSQTLIAQDTLPDLNSKDQSRVISFQYPSSLGAPILYYEVIGGGHHWPSARFNANTFTKLKLGNYNRDLPTNEVILDFF
ncbi:MAG: PHB depolymerase family esterase, partial [Bacteroidota bacterium]